MVRHWFGQLKIACDDRDGSSLCDPLIEVFGMDHLPTLLGRHPDVQIVGALDGPLERGGWGNNADQDCGRAADSDSVA